MTRSITAPGPPGWIEPVITTVWLSTSGGLSERTGGPAVADAVGRTVAGGWVVVAGGAVVGTVVASVGPLTKTVMDLGRGLPVALERGDDDRVRAGPGVGVRVRDRVVLDDAVAPVPVDPGDRRAGRAGTHAPVDRDHVTLRRHGRVQDQGRREVQPRSSVGTVVMIVVGGDVVGRRSDDRCRCGRRRHRGWYRRGRHRGWYRGRHRWWYRGRQRRWLSGWQRRRRVGDSVAASVARSVAASAARSLVSVGTTELECWLLRVGPCDDDAGTGDEGRQQDKDDGACAPGGRCVPRARPRWRWWVPHDPPVLFDYPGL